MSVRYRHCALVWMLIAPFVMVGCGKAPPQIAPAAPPKPVEVHLMISAAPDTNPDPNGRPSPVVVRLYQLKGDAAFAGAEFFGLFDDEEQALGAELISRVEFVLAPAEERTVDVPVAAGARFVGALAAFRDIRNAQWRALVPTWSEGARQMTLAIERARIIASVADPQSDD